MAKGEKPAYRAFLVREGDAGLKDEKGKPIKTESPTFINLGGFWRKNDEGKYSGAFKPSIAIPSKVEGEKPTYVELSELTIKNGEFINLTLVL